MLSKLIYLLVFVGILASCAEKEFDPSNPEKSFVIAREPYDDENYEIALTKLGEFKARFPYSKYAVEAELLIANSHFENGHFTEAAFSYSQFAKLHPSHPQTDFARFRVGECYWSDAPDDVDREQEYTAKAVAEWQDLIDSGKKSQYIDKAKKLIKKGKRRMAEAQQFVAEFYCKQSVWHACAYRNIRLADEFPEFKDIRLRAVGKAAGALERLAKLKEKDPTSDKNLYFKKLSVVELREQAKLLRDKATAANK